MSAFDAEVWHAEMTQQAIAALDAGDWAGAWSTVTAALAAAARITLNQLDSERDVDGSELRQALAVRDAVRERIERLAGAIPQDPTAVTSGLPG